MKRPFSGAVRLREWGSDLATFEEIVVSEIYETVVSSLPKVRTVIDLGANVGLASLYFAHRWPSCRILAVEPNPETFAILESNLAPLIRTGRCRTLRAAVWSANARLASAQEPGRYSAFSVHEPSAERTSNAAVEGQPMADIVDYSGFETIDLLKVDVEGAEVKLFSGDVSWLSRVGSIAIEFHGNSRMTSKFDEVTMAYGFRSREANAHTALATRADWSVGDLTAHSTAAEQG